jgi:FKBP-type peptidyl-prolyl cis-trans isomerase 2
MAELIVEKNSLIKLDYVGMFEDGSVFDTTSEEEAKKAGIYDANTEYKPQLVLVGKEQIIEGLEEGIIGMKENEEKEIFVPYEKGFGRKDATLFRIIPLSRFKEENINPIPGMIINIDGRDGIIQSISGGRVIVDFNHPLAGKNLKYRVKITKILKDTKEKVSTVFEYCGLIGDFEINGTILKVNTKADVSEEYLRRKINFLNMIKSLVEEIKTINFNEEYKLEEKKEEKKEKEKERIEEKEKKETTEKGKVKKEEKK